MNLRVRVKNWSFWLSVALAIIAPIGAYYGITGADMTTWATVWNVIKSAISNPYVLVMVAISVYNTLVDPTTSGVTDSARAMTYTTPGGNDCE